MDISAIEKAKQRLRKAQESLQRVRSSENYEQFQYAWTDLLLAGNAVHSILEQGAKANPDSRQWFGGKKNERRKDPLLSYMHQARNADEHGLMSVTAIKAGQTRIRRTKGPLVIKAGSIISPDKTNLMIDNSDPSAGDLEITQLPARAELITVTDDRFGNSFDPPTEHLGAPLADTSPSAIGTAWVEYLEKLVTEASALAR